MFPSVFLMCLGCAPLRYCPHVATSLLDLSVHNIAPDSCVKHAQKYQAIRLQTHVFLDCVLFYFSLDSFQINQVLRCKSRCWEEMFQVCPAEFHMACMNRKPFQES